MNRHRKIIFIGGVLAALMAVSPTLASASSLLSGYGGPGQGNQAILGSALLNGPRGGGGSAGSGGSGGGAEGAGGSSTGATTGATGVATGRETDARSSAKGAPGGSGAAGSGAAGSGGPAAGTGAAARGARGASGTGARGAPRRALTAASLYPASERLGASQQTGTLGLSTADLLYIILAAGILAFVGVFTSRLTRTDAPGRHR
jgi:hypothetical protein